MANDLMWDHHFCLTCDKQTDGPAYCSESCRLADYEGATSFAPPSGPGSPSWVPSGSSTYRWAMGAAPSARNRQLFSLSPAYDFGNAQPYYGPSSSSSSSGPYNYTRQPAPPTAISPSSSSSHYNRHSHIYTSASASMLSLPPTTSSTTATTSVTYHHVLSPSSSHSSLSSMRSGMSSTGGALGALSAFANGTSSSNASSHAGSQTTYGSAASNSSDLSEKVRSELRKYASSLEQGKLQRQLQRRRSC
ncbi:hypothetical protein SEUCBS139899_007155 [Sporothrix eucalyptigena]|uniref:Life-span regulatory factor domain-containing protein n=1 Tax=Sporothrix eucalyptigena TaxID=1812306 RepID=A0ABP0C3V3_9PEZI